MLRGTAFEPPRVNLTFQAFSALVTVIVTGPTSVTDHLSFKRKPLEKQRRELDKFEHSNSKDMKPVIFAYLKLYGLGGWVKSDCIGQGGVKEEACGWQLCCQVHPNPHKESYVESGWDERVVSHNGKV